MEFVGFASAKSLEMLQFGLGQEKVFYVGVTSDSSHITSTDLNRHAQRNRT